MCESDKVKIFSDENHFSNCFSRLREFKMQQKICDVTLVFNQERLKAHSSILAGCSDYFSSIFLSDMASKGTVCEDVILESVNSSAVSSIVDYCYTGTININKENVFDILSAASLFQLQPVIDACLLFLESSINIKNCIEIFNLSILHNSSSLENRTIDFIQKNFNQVSKSDEFLCTEVNQLKEILNNDFLNISSEDEVFDSVMRWVNHDENRKKYITELVKCVRLPHLSSELLFDNGLPFCGTTTSCTSMMLEAIQVKLLPNKKKILSETQLKERTKFSHTLMIVGSYNQNRASVIEIYNPFENKWHMFMNAFIEKRNFGAVLVDKTLFIVGGFLGAYEATKTVASVDIETRETKSLPSLQMARTHITAVHIAGSIYVAGGRGNTLTVANLSEDEGLVKPLGSMERWDIGEDQWHYSTPMITPREGYGVAVFGNEFYVVGGWSGGFASDKTEAFCPKTAKWRQCAPMLVKRNWLGVGFVNGYLYAVGGRSGYHSVSTHYSSVEKYDSQIDKWTIVTNFRVNRYAMGVGALGKKLITIGGATHALTADVDEYDTETGTWKRLAPLLEPREETNVISVPIAYLDKKYNY